MYLTFLPSSGGWAISLIWAMMILPLADTLQNSLQNLTSRIAGVDNEQMSGRVLGMGAALGYSFGAIKEQFKSNTNNINSNNTKKQDVTGNNFISRVKRVVTPQMQLSQELEQSNVNPIKDTRLNKENNGIKQYAEPSKNRPLDKFYNSKLGKATSVGAKAVESYLRLGANMVEGDFNSPRVRNSKKNKNDISNQKIIINNNLNSLEKINKGENNEFKE